MGLRLFRTLCMHYSNLYTFEFNITIYNVCMSYCNAMDIFCMQLENFTYILCMQCYDQQTSQCPTTTDYFCMHYCRYQLMYILLLFITFLWTIANDNYFYAISQMITFVCIIWNAFFCIHCCKWQNVCNLQLLPSSAKSPN